MSRARESFDVRVCAAQLALDRGSDLAVNNGEEDMFSNKIASFTKGLRHNDDGVIVNTDDFQRFIAATESGSVSEIANLPLGPLRDENNKPMWRSEAARFGKENKPVEVRGWESMAAGLAYDLQGPDAQSVVMPPAPLLDSDELVAEMAEVYLMALARDISIAKWEENDTIKSAIDELNKLAWFSKQSDIGDSEPEQARRRGTVTLDNIFRGLLPGSLVGPYLSQFLIAGSDSIGQQSGEGRSSGIIQYGAISIDTRVRPATSGVDFMTELDFFLDVQDGADLKGLETYEEDRRHMATLRDIATYVHFDALYEAYLNACLIMLANKVPFDEGLPFGKEDSVDKQTGFALYGGPHILTLVTEVATRALKAVRYSKFNVHRRTRPEAIAGLIHLNKTNGSFPEVQRLVNELEPVLQKVAEHNRSLRAAKSSGNNNGGSDEESDNDGDNQSSCSSDGDRDDNANCSKKAKVSDSYLLPMAFSEGSPMHPSYGSGHATVAGACVTVLKAFFKEDHVLKNVFEVDEDGESLVKSSSNVELTVRGELEKLADNISIGRDVAGVHYFSDQWESLLLGERIAIGILEETQLTLRENFQFTLTKFDGTEIKIKDPSKGAH
eukprot:IDg69t1